MKNTRLFFYLKIFIFGGKIFSYLNRHVFVMRAIDVRVIKVLL